MDTKVKFLKELALKVTSAASVEEVTGETVCEVLDYIVQNYKSSEGTQGEAGKDGKSVTAIALTTDETGKVTGGTVTYSDDSTSEITVIVEGV